MTYTIFDNMKRIKIGYSDIYSGGSSKAVRIYVNGNSDLPEDYLNFFLSNFRVSFRSQHTNRYHTRRIHKLNFMTI